MNIDKKVLYVLRWRGVGLFTVAAYRDCFATAIYVISDVLIENSWKLGWDENKLEDSIQRVLDRIVSSL